MKKMLIVYYSMTGNTEMMAEAIKEGASEHAEVTCASVAESPSIDGYDLLAFGCSAMGDEVLEEYEFEPWFAGIEDSLSGKDIALFGSYDWGDGQWMRDWETRVKEKGGNLFKEGLMVHLTPEDDDKETCVTFGKEFSQV